MTDASVSSTPHPGPLPEGEGARALPSGVTVIKWLVCLLIVAFVARALASHISKIDWKQFHVDAAYAILGGVCIALVTLTQIVTYRLLLGAYRLPVRWSQAATLSWLPALGKYVPGKIVAISSTIYLLRRFQIPAAIALSVALMGDALAVLTGLIAGAPMLRLPEVRDKLPGGWIWSAVLVAVGVICLFPPVFTRLVNLLLRRLKREPLSAHLDLRHYLLPVIMGFLQWVLWGMAVWCVTRSIADVSPARMGELIFMTALANTVGYLALFAPGGIGVREGLLLLPLARMPGVGDKAALVVLAVRLIQTVVEILLALVGVVLLRRSPNAPE